MIMGDKRYSIPIFAPMSGSVVDLSQVPDPIYAERMMGDGVAIVPDDGTMFSPVNGYVSVVAEDKHAFGFTTDDGLEILIHLGVDSEIQNDCCAVHVKVNDRVQAGDMIAEFNLAELKKRDINTITPIIICGGLDGKKIEPATGHVQAGSGAVMTVIDLEALEKYEASQKEKHSEDSSEKTVAGKSVKKPAVQSEESDVMEFLKDKGNWPKLIGGFVALTALMVVIFVSIAMFIGH